MAEEILKPIDVMDNDELTSILTIKKDNFNDEFRNKVVKELDKRGIKLDEILNTVKYRINTEDMLEVNVNSAYEKTSLLKEPLDVLYFVNYMKEHLSIQKNSNGFVLHHYSPKVGFSSFFLEDETMLINSLNIFLTLGNWLPEETDIIEHWETFAESTSSAYILRLAKLLDDTEIAYSINSNRLARFNSFSSPYSIVLPVEDMDEAEEVLTKMDELEKSLQEKLEVAEKKEDVDLQLELLRELESVTPEDSILFYNKAQLLDEKGDYQNASEALIESFNLDLSNGTVDDIEDIENYLIDVVEKIEKKSNVLHCLATISTFKADIENSFKYYTKLVLLDENDPIAHLNLGHLFYSETEEDEKVKFHFKKYIEMEPESSERDAIEAILENLI
jgi:tetratricopeptide (TPR) repeat protein